MWIELVFDDGEWGWDLDGIHPQWIPILFPILYPTLHAEGYRAEAH